MRINELGRALRKLRIDNDELLKDMAVRLGYSASFLSAIETGRKRPPEGFLFKVSSAYQLDNTAQLELSAAAQRSVREVKLRLSADATPLQREAAFALARRFTDLEDHDATQILRLLKGTGDEE